MFRAGSAFVMVSCSALAVATWSEVCDLLVELFGRVAIFEGTRSAFGRLCLAREKKDDECVGILEVSDADGATGGLDNGPTGFFSFDSALPDCFADLKPNAPREAIVAAWLAKHSH